MDGSQQDQEIAAAAQQIVAILKPLAETYGALGMRVTVEKSVAEVKRQLFPLSEDPR
jgi:hypothetical protein